MKGKIQSTSDRVKALLIRRSSLTALSLLGVLAIILFIWIVPQLEATNICDSKDYAIENAFCGTLVQAFGEIALFFTFYFTSQNLIHL